MKQKAHVLAILLIILMLSACTPRLVGEAKAKEAGLAFINKVFDVNETEATVEYSEYAVDPQSQDQSTVQKRDVPVMRSYYITVMKENTDEVLYYAQVDAISGFAYSANRGAGTLSSLTEEQIKQAEELMKLPFGERDMMNRLYEAKLPQTVNDWVSARFEKQSQIMSVDYGSMQGDLIESQRIFMDCIVTFENGAVYVVDIAWPTLEINRVEILSQPVVKGR
ncbi:MAG: hypothetical protein VB061_06310 [Christensenella sp.]|nr:hypothetical protein [Christensenella sp.]